MYALINQYMIEPAMGLSKCCSPEIPPFQHVYNTSGQNPHTMHLDVFNIDMQYVQNNHLFRKYRQFTFHPSHFSAERPEMCL